MKKGIIIAVIVVVILGAGIFLYATRPAAAPSANVAQVAQQLPTSNATGTPGTVATPTYRIVQSKSVAQFSLHEVLSGSLNLVVGTTSQIAGDIQLDQANPSASQMGAITIDARTLKTDSGERDGAIAHFILKTDSSANEFVTFAPATISGMPATIAIGTPFTFTVSGNLTIAGVTQSSTWTGTATLVSPAELTGTVSTTVQRSDFGLTIPNIPFVANVDQAVKLSATIVADQVGN